MIKGPNALTRRSPHPRRYAPISQTPQNPRPKSPLPPPRGRGAGGVGSSCLPSQLLNRAFLREGGPSGLLSESHTRAFQCAGVDFPSCNAARTRLPRATRFTTAPSQEFPERTTRAHWSKPSVLPPRPPIEEAQLAPIHQRLLSDRHLLLDPIDPSPPRCIILPRPPDFETAGTWLCAAVAQW